jgi:hypothetical protein
MSLDRSDGEVIDIVEEIEKKLASLRRRVTRLSLDRSMSQAFDRPNESGGFCG